MRELTSSELDLFSAGPSAINPLALVDQCNNLGHDVRSGFARDLPGRERSLTDPLEMAK